MEKEGRCGVDLLLRQRQGIHLAMLQERYQYAVMLELWGVGGRIFNEFNDDGETIKRCVWLLHW